MSNQQSTPSFSHDIAKSQEIYKTLGDDFVKENNGKYISIDPTSGEHFVGETREEAVEKANEKFKDKIVFTRRIGNLEKISAHSSSRYCSPNNYARLF